METQKMMMAVERSKKREVKEWLIMARRHLPFLQNVDLSNLAEVIEVLHSNGFIDDIEKQKLQYNK